MTAPRDRIRELRRTRPRSPFVRASLVALLALMVGSWMFGDFSFESLLTTRTRVNLERFGRDIAPKSRAGEPMDTVPWAIGLFLHADRDDETSGGAALLRTLGIAVAAIAAAALLGLLAMFPAARTFATAEPLLRNPRPATRTVRAAWIALRFATRALLVFVRAVPEYVWAFLLIAIIGHTAWVGVLALAIHNTGILGRLGAEVVENMTVEPASALRALGASRRIIAIAAGVPTVLSRYVIYLFYRWETCVREATILGMLIPGTLGWMIRAYRIRIWYDRVLFFILLGAALILLGDLVSALARRFVRKAK